MAKGKPDPLTPAADQDAIKRAFRQRARQTHPDAGGAPGEFERVNAAYRLLMSPERKARFDATGEIDDGPDNSAEGALSVISDMMNQIIGEAQDIVTVDIVERMRECMDDRVAEIEDQIAKCQAKKKRLTRFAQRFKKKKGHNLLRDMVLRKVNHLDMTVLSGQRAMADIKRAREMLEGYSFDVDDVPRTGATWPGFRPDQIIFRMDTGGTG